MTPRAPHSRGAALVIALAILGLLVLLALSLGAAVRLRLDSAHAATRRALARDHALAALETARGRLRAWAGPEDRITGPGAGGASGASAYPGPAQVWAADGSWIGELTSGRGDAGSAATRLVPIAPGIAGRGPLDVHGLPMSGDTGDGWGGFAVFDEGAKLAVRAGTDVGGIRLQPSPVGPVGAYREIAEADAARVRRMVAFEQLALVVAPSLVRTASAELTLDADPARITVNTDSPAVWQAILESSGVPSEEAAAAAQRAAVGLAAFETAGKRAFGPFESLDAVRSFLATLRPAEPEVEAAAWARIEPFLALRSDRFRVRAVGVVDGPEGTGERTVARAEAVLRRNGKGGGFGVVGFRWLAPDDP